MTGQEPAGPPVRVTLVTRVDCHLCTTAREVVARVCADEGVGWEERDVDADPAWRARWSEEVPVTLVDGRQHDFWRVDETRLRAALAAPPRR
ncbi:glutaredoxin family protein [Phycicoccus flavus]|uniref:glutaredoxin family protein n=1 Tax=Phycicoccus flavus TaxID=2502783 RepID=UPI000FEC20C3|nr:glutaredoxin family protein [Phycicoccus flavus]NHA69750.1 glutaredoxin family protein [Phycicoccus flavus]